MAHQYDNFNSAYNALSTAWTTAKTYHGWANTDITWAATRWSEGNDHAAIYFTFSGLQDVWFCLRYLADFAEASYGYSHLMESIYWANKDIPAADFTMDTLIQTMLVADPNQVEYFVGLVDAYRMSIWNRPFNQEFFAALGRGFRLWP